MEGSPLNDFEKIFWLSNRAFQDDRDNIVIKLHLSSQTEKTVFDKAMREAMRFFPNLNMRVALKSDGEPYFKRKTRGVENVIEVESALGLHSWFNLSEGEAMRFYHGEDGAFFIATHHFYFDEDSIRDFVNVVCDLIAGRHRIFEKPELKVPEMNGADNAYWREALDDSCAPCSFFAPEEVDTGNGVIDGVLSKDIMECAIKFAAENNISMTAMTIAVTAIVMRKLLSEDDMIISTPVTLRDGAGDRGVRCGCRINVLPIPVAIDPSKTVLGLLSEVVFSLWGGIEHRNFSLSNLIEELGIDKEIGLYNVMAEYSDEDANEDSFIIVPNKAAKLALSLSLIKRKGKHLIHVEYDKSKISDDYADVISKVFGTILSQMVNAPNGRVSSLHMCSGSEERRIVENGKGKISNCNTDIVGRIVNVAKRNPDKTAVIHNGETITYKNLLSLSANIAKNLRRQKIKKGTLVGVNLGRTIEYVAAQLALIAIGAPFTPLDTALPKNRVKEIIDEAKLSFVITDSLLSTHSGVENIDIASLTKGRSRLLKPKRVNDEDLAYVIFTSGSTGKPKGVMINYLGFTNHQEIMIDYLGLSESSVVAQSAPVSFDISIWQLVCPLLVGGTIDIIDKDTLIDPGNMLSKIIEDRISVLETVPSLISEYLDYELGHREDERAFSDVKVISTGERITREIAIKWNERYPENPLVNAYGPAEASDDTHFFEISPESISEKEDIPIGAPLNNIGTVVLDCDGQICPQKVIGEICIYGISLANGYLDDAVKTKKLFRYADCVGEKIYMTGDYGRWTNDGELSYNGRRDNQVKIRGQRAELEEIEEKIRQALGLERVAVTLHDFGSNKRLVGFVECLNRMDTNELKRRLAEVLPCYMVPWSMIMIEHLPTGNNGKLDRRRLDILCEKLHVAHGETDDETTDKVVDEIRSVWASILGREIGRESDFFELGGDSLLCLTASNELNKRGVPVGPRDIINGRTPTGVAMISRTKTIERQTRRVKLSGYSDVQKAYLEVSGKMKNSAEVQAGIYTNKKLNDTNVLSLLNKAQRSLPFLKINFPGDIVNISTEFGIDDMVEKNRKKLILGKTNAIAVPFFSGDVVKILFIIHHFCFDVYSWEILCNELNRFLDNEQSFVGVEGDQHLRAALLDKSREKMKIMTTGLNTRRKTRRHQFLIHRRLSDSENLKRQILSSLYDANIIADNSIIILNEMSIRNEGRGTANSIGWGTYYEPQKFNRETSKFSEIDKRRTLEISDSRPMIVFNVIAESQVGNENLTVLATTIYRAVPFIEIDITVGQESSMISVQNNIEIAQNVFDKIRLNLQKSDCTPATPAQQSFLIGSDFGKNDLYREQIAIKIPRNEKGRIKERIIDITRQARTLRTIFCEKGGEILQDDSHIDIPLIADGSCLKSDLGETFLNERKQIPNLRKMPPIRYSFIDTIDDLYLCISYNHVLLDGDSIFFLIDYITSGRNLDYDPPMAPLRNSDQKKAISYWKKEVNSMRTDGFRVFETSSTAGYLKEWAYLSKGSVQLIYNLAKKYSTTPATIVQSIFNCWALQYFKTDSIGYGFVYNTRNTAVNFDNMSPSTNTVPFVSHEKRIEDNILATITKKEEQEKLKEYPLRDILSLSDRGFISFDILLTITTRDPSRQKYDVVYTYEKTDFPLAVDFDLLNDEVTVTAATSGGVKAYEVVDSFIGFIDTISKGRVPATRTVRAEGSNKNEDYPDMQDFKRSVSMAIGVNASDINFNQSFTENGGDSILALKLRSELNKSMFDVATGYILSSKTLIALRKQVRRVNARQDNDDGGEDEAIKIILREYSAGHEKDYHEQAAFRLFGSYDPSAMNSACDKIGDYVKTLRMFYRGGDKKLLGKKSRVKYINIDRSCRKLDEAVKAISGYDLGLPFNPEYGELLRVYTMGDTNGNYWYLFLSFSTLVTDGWSFSELLKTLMKLYASEKDQQVQRSPQKLRLGYRRRKKSSPMLGRLAMSVDEAVIDTYKNNGQRNLTDSEIFEECLIRIIMQLSFGKLLRYENNRHKMRKETFNTIGCFAKYTEIKIDTAHAVNNNVLAYVFENYPKDAEGELRSGRVPEFIESGDWRRPILPPEANYGLFVEKQKGEYVIECYYKGGKLQGRRTAKNILMALERGLGDAR